jgi:hypothetical protein
VVVMRFQWCLLVGLSVVMGGIHGLEPARAQDIIIPYESTALCCKGDKEPSTAWRNVDFVPSADWLEGKLPIGYDDATPPKPFGTTVDMKSKFASVYVRLVFTLDDVYLPLIKSLWLRTLIDDGYVAYLNGTKVALHNMNTAVISWPYNSLASGSVTDATQVDFDISAFTSKLVLGTNVLAVQVHNSDLGSSDLFFDAQLEIEYNANPFDCIGDPSCVDRGDQIVTFTWTNAPASVDRVEIQENDAVVATVPGGQSPLDLRDVPSGPHTYRFFAVKGAQTCYGGMCEVTVEVAQSFRRGDVNGDGKVNIVDPLALAHYLFQRGPAPACLDAADVNDNGAVLGNTAGIIYLLGYLFQSGPAPANPGPTTCGLDPTLDELPRCVYDKCP